MIAVKPPFSKKSVFNTFSVHSKTQSLHFQLPLVDLTLIKNKAALSNSSAGRSLDWFLVYITKENCWWLEKNERTQPLENVICIFSPPSNISYIVYLLDCGFLEFELVFIHNVLAFTELEFKNAEYCILKYEHATLEVLLNPILDDKSAIKTDSFQIMSHESEWSYLVLQISFLLLVFTV